MNLLGVKPVCFSQLLLIGLLLLIPTGFIRAQNDQNLIGTWQANDAGVLMVLVLNSDGTGKLDDASITYQVVGNRLSIREAGVVNNYTFVLRGNNMTVSGGDLDQPLKFERQDAASRTGLGARRNQLANTAPSPVGTWERRNGQENFRLVLNDDGTGSLNDAGFRWTFIEGILSLSDGRTKLSYTAVITANSLELTSGNPPKTVTLNRVVTGNRAQTRDAMRESAANSLIGRWQSREATVHINEDGTVIINGETYRYTVQGDIITLSSSAGSVQIPFQLSGDTLVTTFNGQRSVYTRASTGSADTASIGGSNPSELVGKWCYMSNVNANTGGRMSNRCFTLYANGTYEYYGETSSSGAYGSAASQESDSGTWTATANSITANSRRYGVQTYLLEKRNHPKTGDAMLVLDGDAYVTYNQRPPWPW